MGLSPEYVLDQIQSYEIKALVEFGYLRNKDSWEQSRLISYTIARANGTKEKLENFLKFPWEEKQTVTPRQTEIDKKKLEQVRFMAQEIIKNGFN